MKTSRFIFGIGGFVLVTLIWQLVAMFDLISKFIPSPAETFTKLLENAASASFWQDVWRTIEVAIGGFLLALAAGVVFGVLIATSPLTMRATRVVLEFLKPIPPIVILPLVVLLLGPSSQMGIFLVFYGCVLTIIMQTAAGVFDVDPVAVATARSFSMGKLEVLWRVVLPSSLSYIGTAIRVSIPASLIIAVVAGLLGGGPGLGNSLLKAQLNGSMSSLFAYVIVLGLLGLLFQAASEFVERRILHWHPSYRKEQR